MGEKCLSLMCGGRSVKIFQTPEEGPRGCGQTGTNPQNKGAKEFFRTRSTASLCKEQRGLILLMRAQVST